MAIIRPYYKVYRVLPDPSDYFYIKNEYYGSNRINIQTVGTPNCTDLQYSYDKITWTNKSLGGANYFNMESGETLYFRSTTGWTKDNDNRILLGNDSQTHEYSIGGNLCTLLDYTNADTILTIPDYAFYTFFHRQSNLISAENLTIGNATAAGNNSFKQIFYGCGFTATPDFSGFTTVGNNCFEGAFGNCSALTTLWDSSDLTTIGGSSFLSSFYNCSSLSKGLDFSSATTIGAQCLNQCYNGCSLISEVTTPNVQELRQNSVLSSWLLNAGTQATGTKTVRVPTGATISSDASGVPSGWTRVDY